VRTSRADAALLLAASSAERMSCHEIVRHGLVVGAFVAGAGSAVAVTHGQSIQIPIGDRAVIGTGMGATSCIATSKRGERTFSCYVGNVQYPKRFRVTIDPLEVTVSQYLGASSAKPYALTGCDGATLRQRGRQAPSRATSHESRIGLASTESLT
jgi:hypothetical protein